jgi:adenine-specific DNA-methyltransferase
LHAAVYVDRDTLTSDSRLAYVTNSLQKMLQPEVKIKLRAVVMKFMASNAIVLSALKPGSACYEVLKGYDGGLPDSGGVMTIKQAEEEFESLIDASRKRKEGVVYTPAHIALAIVEEAISMTPVNNPRCADISCGSGGFLIAMIKVLSRKLKKSPKEVAERYVFGCDINPQAVLSAHLLVELYVMSCDGELPQIGKNIVVRDTLLAKDDLFVGDGFDVIATNPPYVKLQSLDEDYAEKLSTKYPEIAFGSYSLANLFIYQGIKLLSAKGALGYITQNNLFTSLSGEQLRAHLQGEKSVRKIVDFGHMQIFETASAYTCLLFVDKRRHDFIQFCQIQQRFESINLSSLTYSKVDVGSLNPKKWRLMGERDGANLARLEVRGKRLGDLCDIKVGFATLKDSVFLVGQDIVDTIEPGLLRDAIKIAELKSSDCLPGKIRKIICPYHKDTKGKWKVIPADEMKRTYPKTYEYLLSNRDLLLARSSHKNGEGGEFYAWGRLQGMEAPGPKLLTKTFNSRPEFFLDVSDSIFCNGYAVRPRPADLVSPHIDMHVLAKLLNSPVMDYYLKLTSFQLAGDYQCFQKNFIENFCIPDLKPSDTEALLAATGVELETLVYKLFDLNQDEVESFMRERV